jgi:transcriptional regulator with XRE-family HTH domain
LTKCQKSHILTVNDKSFISSLIIIVKLYEYIKQKIHNRRKYQGISKQARISQDVLSKKANLAFYTIAKIEAGTAPNSTIDTVKKITDALGVSLDDLMK